MTLRLGGNSRAERIWRGRLARRIEMADERHHGPTDGRVGADLDHAARAARSCRSGMDGAGAWACTSVAPSAANTRTRGAVRVMASTFHGQGQLAWFHHALRCQSRRRFQPSPNARCARGYGWQAASGERPAKVVHRSAAGAKVDGGRADQRDLSINDVTSRGAKLPRPANRSRERSECWRWSELSCPFLERSPQCAGEPFSPSC